MRRRMTVEEYKQYYIDELARRYQLACNPADPSQFVNPGACAGMTRYVCK